MTLQNKLIVALLSLASLIGLFVWIRAGKPKPLADVLLDLHEQRHERETAHAHAEIDKALTDVNATQGQVDRLHTQIESSKAKLQDTYTTLGLSNAEIAARLRALSR